MPFFWEDAELVLDPQVAKHSYPQRKGGMAEDLGHGLDEIEVVGYVLGPDYMSGRDALIKAVKEGGAGALVHPTRGPLQVMCLACRIKESTKEGGMARFTLRFVEAGENRYPTPPGDLGRRQGRGHNR
ncbi:MAG: DNA circularization N-terminal domain-containing protein [Magnetospirillum sp.]|nr:DNA circularization N-terminal domain-containing protein [Magnetospirillum sp.]